MTEILITPDDDAKIAMVDAIESDHPSLETLLDEEAQPKAAKLLTARSSMPIAASCDKRYRARRQSGIRPINQIKFIIMHCTQGGTAVGAAQWFTNPECGGSAHLCLDDSMCFRTLDNNRIPWGAQGANYHGFHIEQAGFVKWSQAMWSRTHRRTIMRAAYKTALHCRAFGIPARWLSAADLRAGKTGISDHRTCVAAFGGSHTDPGNNWPRKLFMTMVRSYLISMRRRKTA